MCRTTATCALETGKARRNALNSLVVCRDPESKEPVNKNLHKAVSFDRLIDPRLSWYVHFQPLWPGEGSHAHASCLHWRSNATAKASSRW